MGTGSTRDLVDDVFSSVSETGFGAGFLDRLAEDVSFTVTGTSPLAGRYASKAQYREKVLDRLHEQLATPLRPKLEKLLVDGEWATVLFRTDGARGRNGADFSMRYCWLIRVVDESITEIIGFYDSKKMLDLFDPRFRVVPGGTERDDH